MPQINLSTLSGPELRQVLDSSRRRGDAALSYKVLQEMAARRETPAEKRSFRKRRGSEPAGLVVELDEPVDTDDLPPLPAFLRRDQDGEVLGVIDEPGFEAAPEPEPEPEPEPAAAAPPEPAVEAVREPVVEAAPKPAAEPPPLRLAEPAPTYRAAAEPDDDGLRLTSGRPPPSRPAKPPRKPIRPPLGFAFGLAVGAAVGWGVAVYRQAPEPAPPSVQTAALSPAPAAPTPEATPPAADSATEGSPDQVQGALTPPAATPPPAAAGAPGATSPTPDTAPAALPPATPAAPAAALPAPPAAPPARAAELAPTEDETAPVAPDRPAAASAAKGCAALSTPADRTICGDPELRRLQKELQKAYAEALAAHQDRALLREHELAWRDSRSGVSDPAELAKLYEARIRKLNAATAEAEKLNGTATQAKTPRRSQEAPY